MEDYAEKVQRCNGYIEALEEERRKIQVFQRELPLCLELVTQAIEGCKQQLSGGTTDFFHVQQSDCSDQTSSDGPVLEEFIPIKRSSDDDDDDDDEEDDVEEESHKPNINTEKSGKKSDWLRSVQLWNQTPDPPHKEDPSEKESVTEVKRNGGAFRPFNKQKDVGKNTSPPQKDKSSPAVPTAAASSSAGTVSGGSRKEDKQGDSQRKQRRCWSPELHRRFLNSLQQLGGPHVATPKQIREFMKVDGLTNDEVKSHLQKYRLHTRRPSSGIHNNGNPQAPQFVVVGGIWVQPSDYAKMGASGEATGVNTTNGIYAPVASPPPSLPQASSSVTTQGQQQHKQHKPSHSEERRSHSTSPSTSSSTRTTTACRVF